MEVLFRNKNSNKHRQQHGKKSKKWIVCWNKFAANIQTVGLSFTKIHFQTSTLRFFKFDNGGDNELDSLKIMPLNGV